MCVMCVYVRKAYFLNTILKDRNDEYVSCLVCVDFRCNEEKKPTAYGGGQKKKGNLDIFHTRNVDA